MLRPVRRLQPLRRKRRDGNRRGHQEIPILEPAVLRGVVGILAIAHQLIVGHPHLHAVLHAGDQARVHPAFPFRQPGREAADMRGPQGANDLRPVLAHAGVTCSTRAPNAGKHPTAVCTMAAISGSTPAHAQIRAERDLPAGNPGAQLARIIVRRRLAACVIERMRPCHHLQHQRGVGDAAGDRHPRCAL